MDDLLPEDRKLHLVQFAKQLLKIGKGPIEVIKSIREKENCSLTAAKDVYVCAAYDKSLYQYQEELAETLNDVFDELEENGAEIDRQNWKVGIDLNDKK